MTVELYRWLGAAINNSLSDLKPVQVKDLEAAFSKLPQEKAKPERLLRSEQAAAAEAAAAEAEMGKFFISARVGYIVGLLCIKVKLRKVMVMNRPSLWMKTQWILMILPILSISQLNCRATFTS